MENVSAITSSNTIAYSSSQEKVAIHGELYKIPRTEIFDSSEFVKFVIDSSETTTSWSAVYNETNQSFSEFRWAIREIRKSNYLLTKTAEDLAKNSLNLLLGHRNFLKSTNYSAEGGLCLTYFFDESEVYLEIYNDGEIGVIAFDSESKRMILNQEIKDISLLPYTFSTFK